MHIALSPVACLPANKLQVFCRPISYHGMKTNYSLRVNSLINARLQNIVPIYIVLVSSPSTVQPQQSSELARNRRQTHFNGEAMFPRLIGKQMITTSRQQVLIIFPDLGAPLANSWNFSASELPIPWWNSLRLSGALQYKSSPRGLLRGQKLSWSPVSPH